MDETVSLNYIQWREEFREEKPYEVISEVPKDCPRTNFTISAAPTQTIRNIRGCIETFNLDDNGFEVRRQQMVSDCSNEEEIVATYLPSVVSLIHEIEPEAEVYIFDWKLRSSKKEETRLQAGKVIDLNDPGLVLAPVLTVHNDQSPDGAKKRVSAHMGSRAAALLKQRYRIINIWRPLSYTIQDFPLALCDGSTLQPEKLLAVDHVRKNYIGEGLYPLYSDDLKWYFLDQQTKDEVLVFKTFDSSPGAKAKCCPHTAFKQSDVPVDAMPRQTIEVRAMVFSE